jgi:hypothetical protein
LQPLTESPVSAYCGSALLLKRELGQTLFLHPLSAYGGHSLKAVICLLFFVIAFNLNIIPLKNKFCKCFLFIFADKWFDNVF